MSAVSGKPTLLAGFATAVSTGRTTVSGTRSALATFVSGVSGGCPGRAVDCPALTQLVTGLSNMGENERWLTTIATELSAADTGKGGVVTVDSAKIAGALKKAGLGGAPPAPVEFAGTTRQVVPPTSGLIDDPINAANGNMIHPESDIEFPSIAAALNITRTWNSLRAREPGSFGAGWSSVLDVHLDVGPLDVVAHLLDGNVVGFVPADGGWAAPGVARLGLDANESGWSLTADAIRTFRFDVDGRLTGWDVGVARVVVARDDDDRIVRLDELVTGRSLQIEWTTDSEISVLRSRDGRSVRYLRDGEYRIVRAESDVSWVTYTWDDDLLISAADADGVALFVNEYDDGARVVRQTSPFGRVSSYEYRDDGMTVFRDAAGVVQAMQHDRFGDLTAVIDVDGSAMRLSYDERHRVVKIVERDGATWHYRYEGEDQVERIDPDGLVQTQVWDDRHRVVESTDRAGNVTRMEHDTEHVAPSRVIQPNGGVIHQALDERGLPTEIVDADGVVTSFEWDSDGQLVATRDAFGASTAYAYDESGYLRGIVPASGDPIVMELAPGGRVLSTVCGEAVSRYDYTEAGRIRGGIEPGDVAWSATFGTHGAMETMSDALGTTTSFGYDASGNVTTMIAPDGDEFRQVYDEVGRMIAAIEPTGATSSKRYDRRGRVVEMTDPRGGVWKRELDVMGRTTMSRTPDGAVTRWSHEANGQPTSMTAPDGRVWRTEYDSEQRPVAILGPGGDRALIEYTIGGRVAVRTSPAGRIERFEYDIAGRLSAIVGIDGIRRETRRDDRGRVMAAIERDAAGASARTTEYVWDEGYRITERTETDADQSRTSRVIRDAGGRIVEEIDPGGVRRGFAWDERGLLASSTDPAGLTTAYDYDARSRVTSVTTPGDRTYTIGYGSDGRPDTITDPAGVVDRMLRDATGAVTGRRHGDGSGWDRVLDPMSREVARVATDGTDGGRFSYDVAGRLLSATVESAAGDVVGEFLWDDEDRLVESTGPDGVWRIERDADGWAIATVDPDGLRHEIVRDARGRIVGVDGPSSGDDDRERDLAGRLTIGRDGTVFRYDDAARIVEIAPVDQDTTTFEYGSDGLLVTEIGPSGRRDLHYDTTGRVTSFDDRTGSTTIDYDVAGRRLSDRHPDGWTVHYGWDGFGRLGVIERTDSSGDVVGRIEVRYDAFDRPVFVGGVVVGHDALTGLPDGQRFVPGRDAAFAGVAVGGVFVIGVRAYDPITRQFLSPDPLLPEPASNGAASAYTYSWNDPVNWIDPTGMKPLSMEEFNALQDQNDKGTFTKAWESIKEDPWGTLAMVGVTVIGAALCFTPLAPIGAGILIGVASTSAVGLATGTFNPRDVALGGAFGAIPGGSSIRGAIAIGAASGAGETIANSLVHGNGFPSPEALAFGTATGGASAGGARAAQGLRPGGSTVATVHSPRPDPNSGPVRFRPPPGATADEVDQVRRYVDGSNRALENGHLSPDGRVSTQGDLRRQASNAAARERTRAAAAGDPYEGHAGHVPDTTWTGAAEPPEWMDMSPRVNTSLGGQAGGYPVGFRPTGFEFYDG